LDYVWSNAAAIHEQQRGDTGQGKTHCLRVEENLSALIPDDRKGKELSQLELFILSAAACLHDVGRARDEGNAVCEDHGEGSAEAIRSKPERFGLEGSQALVVAYVVGAHNRFRIEALPSEPVPIGGSEIDVITLAALFRLADILDTTAQRAPAWVGAVKYGEGNVPPKWLGREAITGWTLDESSRIILHAAPNPDELTHAHKCKAMVAEDVATIAPYLRLKGYPWEVGELRVAGALILQNPSQGNAQVHAFPGMGPYTAAMAGIFKGRDSETDRLVTNVSNWPISLLVGESGAGKTSLIQAGLFPRLQGMAWHCAWTRPYDKPRESIGGMLWRSVLEGTEPKDQPLWSVLRRAAEKARPHGLLVAIDQFEEVLGCPDSVLDELAYDLVVVQSGTVIPNLRILLAFREDSLVRISNRLIRRVVGSAQLPPSVELERLTNAGAKAAFLAGLRHAGIGIDPRVGEVEIKLEDTILADIQHTDDRIYPPYLQMVAETLCQHVRPDQPIITRTLYREECGGAAKIISEYLLRRLDEFGAHRPEAEAVLKALTSSEGTKAKLSVNEVASMSDLQEVVTRPLLARMVDLRMARAVGNDEYEIIHDHLGKMVDKTLVSNEERDVKFIQEQLNAAQRLYEVHRAPINAPLLANLYRRRGRVGVDEPHHSLLLCTCLSNEGSGGAWFWLRGVGHERLLALTAELVSHGSDRISGVGAHMLDDMVQVGDRDYIASLLDGPNARVRQVAAEALARIAAHDDIPLVVRVLSNQDGVVRQLAVATLTRIVTHDDLPLMVEALKNQDSYVRWAAVNALAEIVTHEDLTLVADMLKDQESDVRQAALRTLARIVTRDDLPLIAEALNDQDSRVRWAAVNALAEIVTHEDLALVAEMLKDPESDVRQAALGTLARIETRDDLPLIAEALKDRDPDVRLSAMNALAGIATHEDLALVAHMLEDVNWVVRQGATNALVGIVAHADLALVAQMLENESWTVRQAASKAFAEIVTREDLPLIAERMRDENWALRLAALDALAKIGTHDDLPLIAQGLSDRELRVRKAAAEALAKAVTHEDLSLVAEMLRSQDWIVRRVAVTAFTRIVTPEDLSLVGEMLRSQDWIVRRATAEVLARIATHDYQPLMVEMVKSYDRNVRMAAAEALARILTHHDLSLITELLKDQDSRVRQAAAEALSRIVSRDDLSLIAEMFKDLNWRVRQASAKALAKIVNHDDLALVAEMLKNKDEVVRHAAVDALGRIVTADDLSLVVEMLKSNVRTIRRAVAGAMARIVTRDNLSLVTEMRGSNDRLVRRAAANALARIGTHDDLSLVADMSKDRDWEVRRVAANAFARIGMHEDLPLVLGMLKDDVPDVRKAAASALETLATPADAGQLLDILSERAQGWDDIARSYYEVLCRLDRKFYCPIRATTEFLKPKAHH